MVVALMLRVQIRSRKECVMVFSAIEKVADKGNALFYVYEKLASTP